MAGLGQPVGARRPRPARPRRRGRRGSRSLAYSSPARTATTACDLFVGERAGERRACRSTWHGALAALAGRVAVGRALGLGREPSLTHVDVVGLVREGQRRPRRRPAPGRRRPRRRRRGSRRSWRRTARRRRPGGSASACSRLAEGADVEERPERQGQRARARPTSGPAALAGCGHVGRAAAGARRDRAATAGAAAAAAAGRAPARRSAASARRRRRRRSAARAAGVAAAAGPGRPGAHASAQQVLGDLGHGA